MKAYDRCAKNIPNSLIDLLDSNNKNHRKSNGLIDTNGTVSYKIEQEPGGRSAILLHPPGPQQKISASPHPKFGNSLLHILNPPLMLFKLSLETFFKFFIIINFLIFAL